MPMWSRLFVRGHVSRSHRRQRLAITQPACEILEDRQLLSADAVVKWNNAVLDAIRVDKTAPPKASRDLAIVHTAIFDAVNSIDREFAPFLASVVADPRASKEAAIAAAAHETLVAIFPAQQATFDAIYTTALSVIPDGRSETDGVNVGRAIAGQVLAARANDGSSTSVVYTAGTEAGDWAPTPPAFLNPLLPQWPQVKPWIMTSGDQFRPKAPPKISGKAYAKDLNAVKQIGSASSTTRTSDQTAIAHFWANGPGTTTPPGHWNVVAQIAAEQKQTSLSQNAHLFAVLNTTLADAAIVSWDAKYVYDLWRPVTAIRQADTDNNAATVKDPLWTPLLVTPPFPTYTSGHSTFSGAGAAVLKGFFGTDRMRFVLPSETPGVADRVFTSFSQAAIESGVSRIYAGIHFNFDNVEGLNSGAKLGEFALRRFLTRPDVPVSARLTGGELLITGTSRADQFSITREKGLILVMSGNNRLGSFSASLVTSVIVNTGGGQNVVRAKNLNMSVLVFGNSSIMVSSGIPGSCEYFRSSSASKPLSIRGLESFFGSGAVGNLL